MREPIKNKTIPPEVARVSDTLQRAGFEAYLVGGCVRDTLRGVEPRDWDITTNATPEEIAALFEHTFYENDFGTVGVVNDGATDERLKTIEVTTYRLEEGYSDNRRPDSVKFGTKLLDDLKRRDFTINAIALGLPVGVMDISNGQIVDPFDGLSDIMSDRIHAVGDTEERFSEDALRMMRAVRLATELEFNVSRETLKAIQKNAHTIENIAKERTRDELTKIILSKQPKRGIELCRETGLLSYILPELEWGFEMEQNQAHSYSVFEHLLRALQATADKGWKLEIRLAALFHDIAKPKTRAWDDKKQDWSFHGHEVVGARITKKTLERLRFARNIVEKVVKLVRWHMFFSDTEQITLSAVRRMIRNVGEGNIQDLMNIRIADRVGTGRPKEKPYRFRKYQAMIDEVRRDPVSVRMLKIDGTKVINVSRETPGPRIGWILHALLEEVLDDPAKNTEEYLEKQTKKLAQLEEVELKKLGESGKTKKDEEDKEEIDKIRGKHWVR